VVGFFNDFLQFFVEVLHADVFGSGDAWTVRGVEPVKTWRQLFESVEALSCWLLVMAKFALLP